MRHLHAEGERERFPGSSPPFRRPLTPALPGRGGPSGRKLERAECTRTQNDVDVLKSGGRRMGDGG